MSVVRVRQVEELLREQVSKLIQEKLSEDLGMVTVTDVAVTPDFKLAKIYIVLLDRDQEKIVLQALQNEAHGFQHTLGKTLALRYTPKLEFAIDKSENKIDRVEELLQEINNDA